MSISHHKLNNAVWIMTALTMLTFSGCDDSEKIEPEPEIITELKGEVVDVDFGMVAFAEIAKEYSFIMRDTKTKKRYSVSLLPISYGSANTEARMTLSAVDVVVVDSTELFIYQENVAVYARKTRKMTGVIEFVPGWSEGDIHFDKRLYDLERIEFENTLGVSVQDAGNDDWLEYLKENPTAFKSTMHEFLKEVHDVYLGEVGNQAMCFKAIVQEMDN